MSPHLPLVLASASPARYAVLRRAGVHPDVWVSDVDESTVSAATTPQIVSALAHLKAAAVVYRLQNDDRLVLGCDSLLELDGKAYGKPASAQDAAVRWRQMRGRPAMLHTGHCLISSGTGRTAAGVESTLVRFADISDAELEAYVASGEPLQAAGAFTLEGRSAAYVSSVEGDPANVMGLSLSLLRRLLGELGVAWHELWSPHRD